MDNFTHSLAGWALGQTGLKTKSRKGLAALVLSANMADLDVFVQWARWEPLATHRGFTHSLVGGTLLLPPLLWAMLLGLDRWQVARGARFRSGLALHRGWLLALCFIGAITHPLLDLQTTYAVQLLSPLSGAWYHSDSLFIIDAVLWTLLPVAIALSRWREKRGGEWRQPAIVGLGAALAYIAFNLGMSDTAVSTVRQRVPQATAIFASPPPVLFWRREMVWREGSRIGGADWQMLGGLGPAKPLVNDNMADPVVRRAIAADPALRKFLYWSVLPVASVRRAGCVAEVVIADARYGELAGRRSPLRRTSRIDLCRGQRG